MNRVVCDRCKVAIDERLAGGNRWAEISTKSLCADEHRVQFTIRAHLCPECQEHVAGVVFGAGGDVRRR